MDLWLKAFHIMAVIAWMAGLFYLPRLFVYHAGASIGTAQSETFKLMERLLLKSIMTPAMLATWLLGIILALRAQYYTHVWFVAKFFLVLLLSGFHGYLAATARKFATDKNERSARFFRLINEVPTVLMVGIVLLVVLKPF